VDRVLAAMEDKSMVSDGDVIISLFFCVSVIVIWFF